VTVTGSVIQFIKDPQKFSITSVMSDIAQVVPLTLSLFINIFATSIIARKAWYVRVHGVFGKYIVDCILVGDTTCMYIKEIPQATHGKRDQYPNPFTGNQDIGPPG
jgi:hypothetical protein